MNTGSGKIVVGLMILQSCLNEGKGPAVYVVPDHFLEEQVQKEAARLGIKTTTDMDDYYYTENKSILVMTIQKLVNGKSIFGMRKKGNYPIESIVIDDVHACLEIISSQCMIKIPIKHQLYDELTHVFKSALSEYDDFKFREIVEKKYPREQMLVPFWIWHKKQNEVYQTLQNYDNDDKSNQFLFFSLPLLKDSFITCNCIFTASYIRLCIIM